MNGGDMNRDKDFPISSGASSTYLILILHDPLFDVHCEYHHLLE
jgi:hypothetical protein